MRMFLTPKWLASHALLTMLVVMLAAGFWQLDRLDARKASNEEIRTASESPALRSKASSLWSVLVRTCSIRPRSRIGRFLDEPGLLVANRTFDTEPGFWFVAPLGLDDGRIVLVSRGWIRGRGGGSESTADRSRRWSGDHHERLFASVDGGRLGSPVNGVPQVSRLDLDTAQDAIGLEVVDAGFRQRTRTGVVVSSRSRCPPTLDEGPHLSYAFQWFFFGVDRDRLR